MFTPEFKTNEERDAAIFKIKEWIAQIAENQESLVLNLSKKNANQEKLVLSKHLWLVGAIIEFSLLVITFAIYHYMTIYLCILPSIVFFWLLYTIISDIKEKTKYE